MKQSTRVSGMPVAIAALAAILVAMLGGLMTTLGPWYYGLHQPAWNPPDWAFAPAWTLIFALTALSGLYGWRAIPSSRGRLQLIALFLVNAVLNIAWSALFFRLERPDLALLDVAGLWLSIAALIAFLARRSRRAAWLLVPYLAWVSFAGVLNLAIVQLNAPFNRS